MAVTIQMIGEKDFKIKAHGYDPDEVDEFLDEIADQFEEMEGEISELNTRLAAASSQASAPQKPAVVSANASNFQEESVKNLLVNAQRVCDETIANARARAEELVRDAKQQAETIVTNARAEVQQLSDEMEAMRAAAADYRARFQRLVDDQAHILKGETELFKKN